MRSKFKWTLVLFMALIVQVSFAQEKTLSGVVTESGVPLPGATVIVKGTQHGTQTDLDGRYTLKVNPGDVLVFSFIGLTDVFYTVGVPNSYNASMITDEQMLEEVVVLGYGQVRRKSEVTGNVVSVKGDIIEKVPLVSPDQALQGRVAGLQMSTTSGAPGAKQDIRIRGANSISASRDPLIVIDGVMVTNKNMSGTDDITSLSPLSSINSSDIESITVLKDAGSTAVYGARGANGVILITTKRGKSGDTKFTLNTSMGFQNNAVKGPTMLNGDQKKELYLEALYNSFSNKGTVFTKDQAYQWGLDNGRIPGTLANYVNNGEHSTNWGDEVRRKDAPISNLNFSAVGGNETHNFFASLGHTKSEGTVIGSDFRRITGSLSLMQKLSDKIEFNTSLKVSNTKQNALLENAAFFSNPNLTRLFMNPWVSPYNPDGSYYLPPSGLANILYVTNNNINRNDFTRMLNNNSVSYEIIDGLKFTSSISMDYGLSEFVAYQNPIHGDGDGIGGSASNYINRYFAYNVQNSLEYRFYIAEGHRVEAKVVYEYDKAKNSLLQGYGEVMANGFTSLGTAATNYNATAKTYDFANQGIVGLLNYNYLNRYLLDFSIRREGNTRFSDDKRWGTFASVGAAWNIHEEDFMRDSEAVSTLRLRGSYGTNGNAEIAENKFQLLGEVVSYDGQGGISPTQLGGHIGWEKQGKLDVGVELGFINDRITLSGAYFKNTTKDLLYNRQLSYMSGFESQIENVGRLENSGFEVELNIDIFRTDDFNWSIGGNLGTVKNEITEMPIIDGESLVQKNAYRRDAVGHPIYAWNMPTYGGVNPDNGNAQWYKEDGSLTEVFGEAEHRYQDASPLPTYSGGVFTHIDYKGFFVDALFSFAGGNKVYEDWSAQTNGVGSTTLSVYNGVDKLMDRWQQPGDITSVPRVDILPANTQATSPSTRFLYDGDYVRLRNIAFGYNFKSEALRFMKLDGLSLSVIGTNLVTWVKDSRLKYDPEIDGTGFTSLTAPPVKSVVFAINVKF